MSDFIEVKRKPKKEKAKETKRPDDLAKHYVRMIRAYKTEKCSSEGYHCPAGKQCFYAHSDSELRRDPLRGNSGPERYARGLCANKEKGECHLGRDCPYSHNDCETMYHPRTYKTKPCKHGVRCERGIYCAFKHEEDILTPDLRADLFLGGQYHDTGSVGDVEQSPLPSDLQDSFADMSAEEIEAQRLAMLQLERERGEKPHIDAEDLKKKEEEEREKLARIRKEEQERNRLRQEEKRKKKEEQAAAAAAAVAEQKKPEAQAAAPTPAAPPQAAPVQPPAVTPAAAAAAAAPPQAVAQQQPSAVIEAAQRSAAAPLNHSPFGNGSAGMLPPGLTVGTGRRPVASPSSAGSNTVNIQRLASAGKLIGCIRDMEKRPVVEAVLDFLSQVEEGRIATDSTSNTALIHAVSKGLVEFVPLLANARTIDAPNMHQQTPLTLAIQSDSKAMTEELLKHGANPNIGEGALISAIKQNCLTCASFLARSGVVDLLLVDPETGNSALILAAMNGFADLTRQLLLNPSVSSTINQQNLAGETALALAAKNGHYNVLIALLHGMADPNICDMNGNSPLLLALLAAQDRAGSTCVEVLLQMPGLVDVSRRNNNSLSPIAVARQRGLSDFVRRLVELGAVDDHLSAAPIGFPGSMPHPTLSLFPNPAPKGVSQQLPGQHLAQQVCTVCQVNRAQLQTVPCNHGVCTICAEQWFRSSRVCPSCSFSVERLSRLPQQQQQPPANGPYYDR